MDTRPYNDYVLQACVQAGWVSEEQQQIVRTALPRLPGVSALDFLRDQGLINQRRHDKLMELILQAEQGPEPGLAGEAGGPASPAAPAVGAPAHAYVESSVSATGRIRASGDPVPTTNSHLMEYLQYAVGVGASDLHLGPEFPPLVRYNGLLLPIAENAPRLTAEATESLAREFLDAEQTRRVEEIGSIDFCYEHPGLARFRSSVVRQRRGWECVFRVINSSVRTMQELELPKVLYELIKYHNGLVLVTGPVGCGKTTTLAAMVDQVNNERRDHIITLEDPIEYVFTSKGCQITQREVRTHTESFATALRASLREDPDVIMVGEMRDLETISLAITASETGHLVLATLHTSTAARTMQRLLDVFPVDQQAQIRTMVSESMRGVVCQQLIPRADGQGRVLALEIMVNTPAISNLIREGKNFMIPGIMQTGRKEGMRLLDDSLLELAEQGLISAEEAHSRAENRDVMAASLARLGGGRKG